MGVVLRDRILEPAANSQNRLNAVGAGKTRFRYLSQPVVLALVPAIERHLLHQLAARCKRFLSKTAFPVFFGMKAHRHDLDGGVDAVRHLGDLQNQGFQVLRRDRVGGPSEPADVHDRIAAYSAWLKTASLPKFFIDAEPGVFITGRIRKLASSFPNQDRVVVRGLHFVQEDSPDEVGAAIAGWLERICN